MNKLKNVVRAISPFTRGKRSSEYDVEQAGHNLYNESMWQNRVENLNIKLFMELFYRRYNPEKIHTIEFILEQFAGRENDMLLMLTDKYNVSRGDVYAMMDRAQKTQGQTGAPSTTARAPPPPPPPRGAQAAPPPPPAAAAASRATSDSLESGGRNQPATGTGPMSPAEVRRAVELFYKRYNPQKMQSIDSVLDRYAGHEDELLQSLKDKYEASNEDMVDILSHARQLPMGQKSGGSPAHSSGGRNGESGDGSVSSFVNGLGSMQQAPSGRADTEHRQGAPVRQVPKQMSHREVNQSLRGVIFEVRNNNKPAPQASSSASRTSLSGKQSSLSQAQSPRGGETQNQSRLRAILDTESESSQLIQSVPFEAESSSGGEESASDSGTEGDSVLKDPKYKYDYADVKAGHPDQSQKTSLRQQPMVGRSTGITISNPHLNGGGHKSTTPSESNKPGGVKRGKDIAVEADTEAIAAQLEQAKSALSNSKNDKTDMYRLLEMMASNPGNLNGAIAEFIRTHESAESDSQTPEKTHPPATSGGPFVLGHHSRFNSAETPKSTSSIGEHSRGSSRERSNHNFDRSMENSMGHNRVLNLSDLHGHHQSLEQDIASLATNRTGRSSTPTESRGRNSSAPHMRATKASIKRETDTAKDAKSSGRFVPFHDGGSPVVQITRARSPAPGISRSNWTGATPSEEDLQKLTKRSTSSTALYRGRGGTGLGYDSSAAWGERPRTSRAPSPSGYDVRGRHSRAPSPTPSVRSIDSFGTNGSLNARNVANRYSSPSPSVRSNYSARSGSQNSRIPGREPSNSKRSASPAGPSGGGRIYFKESNTNGQQYTGNTNNSSVEGKEKERSALLEEQYKLAKKYLDHGLEQARVSQKMAELNLKSSSRRVSGHTADAVASVEHDAGVDDWVECYDPRTKRNYYHSKSRMKSTWSRPEQATFNWSHNPKNDKKADASSVASRLSRSSTPSKRPATGKPVRKEINSDSGSTRKQADGSASTQSKPEWRMVKDENTGRNYWYNRKTRETTWYDPYKEAAAP